jgi:hypothetical protein
MGKCCQLLLAPDRFVLESSVCVLVVPLSFDVIQLSQAGAEEASVALEAAASKEPMKVGRPGKSSGGAPSRPPLEHCDDTHSGAMRLVTAGECPERQSGAASRQTTHGAKP